MVAIRPQSTQHRDGASRGDSLHGAPASDLFDQHRMEWAASERVVWGHEPGDDDPDEGETFTLGEFCDAVREEMQRRKSA